MNKRVELVRRTEANGISIEAVVTDEGDLLVIGREDLVPEERAQGHHEEEYWLRVPAAAKDAALLALLENFFGNSVTAVADLRAVLLANGVPCELFSH
ncbi:hypothetical protein [Thioalkalivibrio sp. XN279]|uniref:hypothetical protein n=1 Tax=Thioalkalivibrio sp. XN279 TaxID=2714953 RepID=UPI001409D9B4|nr:hypothetical protein [Thioalkalivibrio sp. XN279]NHA14196.1 hypothetical protein [Thioalkalivibrio sp. XN279]